MTPFPRTDQWGTEWVCSTCGQGDFPDKQTADACCQNLIERTTPPQLAKKRPMTKRQSEDRAKPYLGLRKSGAKGY